MSKVNTNGQNGKHEKKPAPKNLKDDESDWSETETGTVSSTNEPPIEWQGWKKTIRRIVKYTPGQKLPLKKLIKKLKVSYKKGVPGASESYNFKEFKASLNEKIKKVKYVQVKDKNVLYSREESDD